MLKNRFIIIIGILLSASLLSSVFTIGMAQTGVEVDIPEYTIGDYWIYNSTKINNITGELRYEVSNITDVQDYWNDTHECYEINSTMEFTMEWENQSIEVFIKGDVYERTADLFAIEYIGEVNMTIVDDEYFESTYHHSYYQYPGPPTLFPLIMGSQYNITFNGTTTILSNKNGSEHNIAFEEPVVTQYSVSIDEVLHTITTPAGTFECVEIAMHSGDENVNITTVRYYSPDVGRDVKSEMIQEFQGGFSGIIMTSGDELLEYERATTFSIPGFFYLGIYCLLGITAIILHRRFKNR